MHRFENVSATDMDHHIQYESVKPDSFYTSFSGIVCHILLTYLLHGAKSFLRS